MARRHAVECGGTVVVGEDKACGTRLALVILVAWRRRQAMAMNKSHG